MAVMFSNYENRWKMVSSSYEKYGVHQVKTGYVGDLLDGKEYHSSQFGVLHYRKVIEAAAVTVSVLIIMNR